MMKFFSNGTWHPRTGAIEEIPTPVGELCFACVSPIQAHDDGISMVHMDTTLTALANGDAYRPWHLACFRDAIGIEKVKALPIRSTPEANVQRPADNNARVRFTIQCYPTPAVSYNDPDHPRHTFPENWDSPRHPRFDFERIQSSFERLIAKGYTLHLDSCGIKIHNDNGERVFVMEIP